MKTTKPPPTNKAKVRAQPARAVRLTVEPTPEESGVLIITRGVIEADYFVDRIPEAYGQAFCLSKFDGTSYAVNLGDADNPPTCECLGFLRWGHRGPCKHLGALRVLVQAGKL